MLHVGPRVEFFCAEKQENNTIYGHTIPSQSRGNWLGCADTDKAPYFSAVNDGLHWYEAYWFPWTREHSAIFSFIGCGI